MGDMTPDPFRPGNLSSLGTFRGAYYDDDSTEIGSDDLSAPPKARLRSRPLDSQARWIAIIAVAPFAIALIIVLGLVMSRF